ncbi:CPBP family intramembrane glutamic endopeptidase [Deinococcus yavapaiensis]|uniref:CAAX prenyl protease-like protein n=1 Tax=Deinococcus yavapaiensis KR-236 TaxID=694435 RepID=A0A318S6J1_9DEIO|nr:CPBP family intramembrane glutamic endopeptidase [Deinococcus yavapaiensis]PYE50450.1 CAAX prenyl protease-like protein [Deinococcus yavapaiensis KR-236]
MTSPSSPRGSARRFLIAPFTTLFPLGLLGVASVLPTLPALLTPLIERMPTAPSLAVLMAASTAQLTVLTALGVLAGAFAAHRVGFTSRIVERDVRALKRDVRSAVLPGLLTGAIVVGLDVLTAPLMGEAWTNAVADQQRTMLTTLSGLLYGGITEELQMRWGLVSLVTLGLWKLLARRTPRPPAKLTLLAVVLIAVLFGIGHLGAAAALVPLTPSIVARTVVINALAGVVFGWLFTRRSLESAMVAHALSHVAISVLAFVL